MDPNQDNQNGGQSPQAPVDDSIGGGVITPTPEPEVGGDQAPAQEAPQGDAGEAPGAMPPPPPAVGDQPSQESQLPSDDSNPAA